jgi:hypothetical protein
MAKDPNTIRRHVRPVVRTVVSELPEMGNRRFDYGIVPIKSGAKGLRRQRLPEWGPVVRRILQVMNVSWGYPKPNLTTATKATHEVTLTKGITALAKMISKLT